MVETPDTTKPTISVVVLNLGTGDIIMNISETVDQTPSTNVIFKSFVIRNDSSTSSTQVINISDGGGTYSPYNQYTNIFNDSASIVFKLTENQRSSVLRWSSHQGGDGIATMLYVQSDAFFDIASNYLDAVVAMPITELKDVIQPNIMRVTLNLMNGTLFVEFNEHIQTSASSLWINTTRIFISNTSNITACIAVGILP